VRPLAQAEYKDAEFTPLSLFNFFVNRCRENLHIVLAMSPIGDAFRNRLRQFPSLINCCTIDWFQVSSYYSTTPCVMLTLQAWPEDALEMVAKNFLQDIEMSDDERKSVVSICKYFHQSTREQSKK